MRFYCLLRESSDPQERKKGLARQWRQLHRFIEIWRSGPHEIARYAQITESASRGNRREWQEAVERGIEANMREWKTLLEKDLADYPDILIYDKKRELTAERQSLEQRQARIKAELATLPNIDPAEVEQALMELAKPWRMCNTGGYYMPHPMCWELASVASGNWRPDMQRKLTDEQAHLLRETLLKVDCRITVKNRAIFISGKLPVTSGRVKQAAS